MRIISVIKTDNIQLPVALLIIKIAISMALLFHQMFIIDRKPILVYCNGTSRIQYIVCLTLIHYSS